MAVKMTMKTDCTYQMHKELSTIRKNVLIQSAYFSVLPNL